jgi:hypothetical protein
MGNNPSINNMGNDPDINIMGDNSTLSFRVPTEARIMYRKTTSPFFEPENAPQSKYKCEDNGNCPLSDVLLDIRSRSMNDRLQAAILDLQEHQKNSNPQYSQVNSIIIHDKFNALLTIKNDVETMCKYDLYFQA